MVDKKLWASKGIPEEFINKKIYPELMVTKSYLDEWVRDHRGMGMFLGGNPGSGKTFCGIYTVKQLLKSKIPARRITMDRINREYKDNYNKAPEILYTSEALFIDDVDANNLEKFDKDFAGVLKYRKERRFRTIVASSDTINVFKGKSEYILKTTFIPVMLDPIDFRIREWSKTREEFFEDAEKHTKTK